MSTASKAIYEIQAKYTGRGDFKQLSDDLKSLKKVESFDQIAQQFTKLNQDFVAAKAKVRELRQEMAKPGNSGMQAEYDKAVAASAKLSQELNKQREKLNAARTELQSAGVSVSNLSGEYGRLKNAINDAAKFNAAKNFLGVKSIAETKAQMSGLVQAYREIASSSQTSAADQVRALAILRQKTRELYTSIAQPQKIQAARDLLGVTSHSVITAEIAKVKQAYADLSKSGTLSMQEMAQAKVALGQKIDELKNKTNGWRSALEEVKGGFLEVAASVAPMVLAVGQAIKFESAMAGVKKVVETTPAGLSALRDEILSMTRALPLAAGELAQIAAAGGQLGVAAGDIGKFTLVTAKMATAFDMTAEAAGDSIGKIKNVYQLGIKEVEDLGDAINQLGNNSAARERDIVEVMLRVGGSAKQFGLAKEQTAALAASMLSLGKPVEVAGTSINTLLNRMQTATMQAPDFHEALGKIGTNAKKMAADVAANPQKALNNLLATLEKLDGQERAEVLTGLFGKEFQDDIAVLVGSLGTYKDALGQVADKTRYAGSMNREFETRTKTTENQIRLLKNAVNEAGINLGTTFLPAIRGLLTPITWLIRLLSDFSSAFPKLSAALVTFGTGALIFGQVAKFAGIAKLALISMAAESIAVIRKMMTTLAGLRASMLAAGGAMAVARTGMLGFTAAIAANPIGAALVATVLAGAAAWAAFGGTALDAAKKHAEAAEKIGEARKEVDGQLESLLKLQKVFKESKPDSDEYIAAEKELARILPKANIHIDEQGNLMAKVGGETDKNSAKLKEHIALLREEQGLSFALQLEQQAKAIAQSSTALDTYKQELKDLYGYGSGEEPTWLQALRKAGHQAMGSYDGIIAKGQEARAAVTKQKADYEALFQAMKTGGVSVASLGTILDKMHMKAELKQSIVADYQKFIGVIENVGDAAKKSADAQEAAFRAAAENVKGEYAKLAEAARGHLDNISERQDALQQKLRAMSREKMSGWAVWKDMRKEAEEYEQKAEEAARAGDFKKAQALFDQAAGKWEQLATDMDKVKGSLISSDKAKKIRDEGLKRSAEAAIEMEKKMLAEEEERAAKLEDQIGTFKDGWRNAFEEFLKNGSLSIESLEKKLDALTSKKRTINVTVNESEGRQSGGLIGALRMASGGAVTAFRSMLSGGHFPGFGGGDRRHVIAEDGEYMIDKFRVRHAGLNTIRALHAGRYDIVIAELSKRLRQNTLSAISRSLGGIIDSMPTLPPIGPQYMAAGGAVVGGGGVIRHEHIIRAGKASATVYTDDLNADLLVSVLERRRRMSS